MSKRIETLVKFPPETFGVIERRAKELGMTATHYLCKCVVIEDFLNREQKAGKELHMHSFGGRVTEKVVNL